jgi:hypothetical protein
VDPNLTNEVKKLKARNIKLPSPNKDRKLDPAKPMLINDGEKKRYLCPYAGCDKRY